MATGPNREQARPRRHPECKPNVVTTEGIEWKTDYDHAPPEVNSESILDSSRTQRGTSEPREIPSSGSVTMIDVDDDGKVTNTVMTYGITEELATDD
ncbi:hypothetical protein [Mycolicibacterium sp. P1-18]|uniref:hypothetical protein n=1 Tax=Mycolicibacterium sp. P1-18 TaxID=2024615 RepID=UPI0011F334E8|nr:hypothetical protein [Mycolicibacterium sp. P1-18]